MDQKFDIPEEARLELENIIWNEVEPEDSADRVVGIINCAIRHNDYHNDKVSWKFIECALAAEDPSLICFQLTVDGDPRTFTMSIEDIYNIARS